MEDKKLSAYSEKNMEDMKEVIEDLIDYAKWMQNTARMFFLHH